MPQTTEVRAQIKGQQVISGSGGDATLPFDVSAVLSLADGAGANQANVAYFKDINIAASGTDNVDLAGSATDRFGQTVNLTGVKAVLVTADATNTNDIIVGNGTNPFVGPFGAGTHTIAVKPGGAFLITNPSAAGFGVTGSTADILKLANSGSGTSVTGKLVVIGK